MQELAVGDVLDGRFKILRLLVRGGMAFIYEATDTTTGNPVAIKIPLLQFEADPAFYSRFLREEEIGQKLRHPSILCVHKVTEKSRPYIVMELLKGQTLGVILREKKRLPVADALKICSTVCDALSYMHRPEINIIHRDLKPDNMMLCDDGTLRLMDFGISRSALRKITLAGLSSNPLGTPDYMAPEQVRGRRGDARTDLYGLGAMLYEMVTGEAPFKGENNFVIMNARLVGDPVAPRTLNPELPPEVEEIILHAMEREPKNRYQSAAEMKQDLDNPSAVTVTGRSLRLNAPDAWKVRLSILQPTLIAIIAPLVGLLVFYMLFRKT
jgi:serine/threonine-protein kinase